MANKPTKCWCVDCQENTTNPKGYCDSCVEHNCAQEDN